MTDGKSIATRTESTRNLIEYLYGWVCWLATEPQSRPGRATSIPTIVQTLERNRTVDKLVVPVQKKARARSGLKWLRKLESKAGPGPGWQGAPSRFGFIIPQCLNRREVKVRTRFDETIKIIPVRIGEL